MHNGKYLKDNGPKALYIYQNPESNKPYIKSDFN